MTCRICLPFGILVLFGTLCSPRLAYAQSQDCADSTSPSSVPVRKIKISIVGVEFQDESPLSGALRAQLVEEIRHSEHWIKPEEPDSSWVSMLLNPIREALGSQGYFRANVDGTPYLVRALATERLYVLRVAIETGPQCRLGKLRFANISDKPLQFADGLLRQQFALQQGDLFDVTKVREGLEGIGRLYGMKGYIDATPEPEMAIDEKASRIDLLIKVDEQQPYRIAKIELLSLNAKAQNKPRLPQEHGDVFIMSLWRNFFEENKSLLPVDTSVSKNMRVQRNVGDATVDITLDFRPCPKTAPLER